MIQLQILSGKRAGVVFDSSKPPVTIGRSNEADVFLDEPGVWPSHCKIEWLKEGLVLEVQSDALASVNGVPLPRAVLRHGDLITLGAVNLRFHLGPVKQYSAALREWLTWIALAILCLSQVAVIYFLTR